MDIASMSMYLSQAKAMQSIGTSLLAKQLDVMEAQGDMMAQSMASAPSPSLESLVSPSMGTAIDMTV